jgi:hypothetical protein
MAMKDQVRSCKRSRGVQLVILTGLLLMSANAIAQNSNLGTSGAQFLQIPVGGRAAAMAGACIASASDASALFWNPAGIVNVRSNDVFFGHTEWWASIQLNHAAYVHTTEDLGSFGVAMSVLSMDKMEVTTELQPEGTGQFFDAQDIMIGATYARRLTEDFCVGLTVKYVGQRIWNETASGMAFDVGTQYKIGFRDLTIAMSMTNFGGDLTYDGLDLNRKYDASTQFANNRLSPARLAADGYPLPLHFQVGLSMTALSMEQFEVLLATDVTHPNDNSERVNVGTEIRVLDQFFVRGGYRFGYDIENATFGAGVSVPLGDTRLFFDYAYALYDLLPNINRFSIGMRF